MNISENKQYLNYLIMITLNTGSRHTEMSCVAAQPHPTKSAGYVPKPEIYTSTRPKLIRITIYTLSTSTRPKLIRTIIYTFYTSTRLILQGLSHAGIGTRQKKISRKGDARKEMVPETCALCWWR